jgi:hypothetical protein
VVKKHSPRLKGNEMNSKFVDALCLSMGQRIGLLFFLGIGPILGLIAFSVLDYRILSSAWNSEDSVENWLVIGNSMAFILSIGFFWPFFFMLLRSAKSGVVCNELVARYGKAAVKKWFGIND